MKIFPAIDLFGGKAVRLFKGDFDFAKTYSENPAMLALSFQNAGAEYLHIVDLDGAKTGKTQNGETIEEILKTSGLKAEIGGGIRDMERVEYYLRLGAYRVILGTAAVKNPTFLKEAIKTYGSRIAVGVDLKDGFVAVDGWKQTESLKGEDFILSLKELGLDCVIVTDVGRDGALLGTNLALYERLQALKTGIKLVASGGVTRLEEVRKLRNLGADGVILGKALYEGVLDLSECLKEGGAKC